ncbi:unnamed protein product [Protopolystoma xenopodis]|uniref:Uncharacterized protein n=1 Tax=Protopolystoma xenopodis TaxID=117903 RepID=A0A3S4ZHK9_9PLAT|nr:unnamed protein product [Protopolystoma xenopodis]
MTASIYISLRFRLSLFVFTRCNWPPPPDNNTHFVQVTFRFDDFTHLPLEASARTSKISASRWPKVSCLALSHSFESHLYLAGLFRNPHFHFAQKNSHRQTGKHVSAHGRADGEVGEQHLSAVLATKTACSRFAHFFCITSFFSRRLGAQNSVKFTERATIVGEYESLKRKVYQLAEKVKEKDGQTLLPRERCLHICVCLPRSWQFGIGAFGSCIIESACKANRLKWEWLVEKTVGLQRRALIKEEKERERGQKTVFVSSKVEVGVGIVIEKFWTDWKNISLSTW